MNINKGFLTDIFFKIQKNKVLTAIIIVLLIAIFIVLTIYTDIKFATEIIVFITVLITFYLKLIKVTDILKELTIIVKKGIPHEIEEIIKKEGRIKVVLNNICDDFGCDIVSIWGYHNGINAISNELPYIKSSLLVASNKHLLVKRPFPKDLNIKNDVPEIKLLLNHLWDNEDILITHKITQKIEKEVGTNNLVSKIYNENAILSSYIFLNKKPLYSISLDWIKNAPYEKGNYSEKIKPYIEKINEIIGEKKSNGEFYRIY